jgi:hypothetical protein
MDLPQWDESYYMSRGRDFTIGMNGLGDMFLSPSYNLLYAIFTKLFTTITSVFLMKYFLTITLSLLLSSFLLQNLKSSPIVIFLTFLWGAGEYNLNVNNMVYHFGAAVFLLALINCNKRRLISIALLLLCCFIRTEYTLILIPYSIYSAILFIKNKRIMSFVSFKSRLIQSTILVILLMLLVYILANVTGWGLNDRTWFAFKQHYALAKVQEGHYNLNPWFDYNIITDKEFPNAHSMLGAFLKNPSSFLNNAIKNIPRLSRAVLDILLPAYFEYRKHAIFLIFASICAGCIFLWKEQTFLPQLKKDITALGDVFVLSVISPLALIPSLLIYPRIQYALVLMPFILLYSGILYLILLKTSRHELLIKGALYVLICAIIITVLTGPMPFRRKDKQRPFYAKVLKLRQIWPNTKAKLFGIGATPYANYLGHEKCAPIEFIDIVEGKGAEQKKVSLSDVIVSFKPDVVLVNQLLLSSPNFDQNSLKILYSQNWEPYTVDDEKFYFLK